MQFFWVFIWTNELVLIYHENREQIIHEQKKYSFIRNLCHMLLGLCCHRAYTTAAHSRLRMRLQKQKEEILRGCYKWATISPLQLKPVLLCCLTHLLQKIKCRMIKNQVNVPLRALWESYIQQQLITLSLSYCMYSFYVLRDSWLIDHYCLLSWNIQIH